MSDIEEKVAYIKDMVTAIAHGYPMGIATGEADTYVLFVETEEEVFQLEILKDNRFGRKLDS